MPYDQAWESVREEWAFLSSEADEPVPKPEDQPGVTRLLQKGAE